MQKSYKSSRLNDENHRLFAWEYCLWTRRSCQRQPVVVPVEMGHILRFSYLPREARGFVRQVFLVSFTYESKNV